MNDKPKCDHCGRFMRCEAGSSYAMRYSGYPPCPDHEQTRCKSCTEAHGPLTASHGIAEWTAGIIPFPSAPAGCAEGFTKFQEPA